MLCLLLMFHILCFINTRKFEFAKKQYLHELMQNFKYFLKIKNALGSFGNHSYVMGC